MKQAIRPPFSWPPKEKKQIGINDKPVVLLLRGIRGKHKMNVMVWTRDEKNAKRDFVDMNLQCPLETEAGSVQT